jgi:hypothetical protein
VSGCWRKENKESSGADPHERSPKKTKRKKSLKAKKEMEYPKAHRIGRRKVAREFKNPKEISPKPQNKINMLTKIQKERRYNTIRRKKKLISFHFIYI